jgi:hypothetical protein
MTGAVPYEKGALAKLGATLYYVTTTDKVADWSRLYWVQMKVLSKRYGCLAKSRKQDALTMSFFCRDGRKVVFWRKKDQDWIHFYSRQYDRRGRPLHVKNHRRVY